ncbi:ATP-binding protein [Streptomyces lunaelactis]|uniref:AlbA family DNA-binding domain-containing protein n=1 Tax=Streptomyces lunaelactis TaxID=1535768 RepID=UPI0015859284|nr:ATP-binding protein [Streptomyces lunaelactis]NUK50094.1 ATP-binding protein [Streptomyces lunaelactis]
MRQILSSDIPRWIPKTEADLQAAIDGGLVEESHTLDLKEAPSNKNDNKELARDLASFAVDGGTLIIGVKENKDSRTFELAPQPMNGLPEKVEQVARSIPDPPLNVITEVIDSTTGSNTGYLVVHIPASPAAPHMVDGRYFGRGDKTKHRLTDPEVLRLHAQRNAAEADALALLQKEMDQDPLRDVGEQSHFFLVAQPAAGRRDLLLGLTGAPDWNIRLARLIERAHQGRELNEVLGNLGGFSPGLSDAHQGHRRAGGVARSSANLGDGRTYTPGALHGDENVIELQVFENGGLRLFLTRFSDTIGTPDKPEQQLIPAAAVLLTRRLLEILRLVAEDSAYFGNWSLAVGVSRMRGRRSYQGPETWNTFGTNPRYSEDIYQEATGATLAELTAAQGAVTRRLLGPLLRSLSLEGVYEKALTDNQ